MRDLMRLGFTLGDYPTPAGGDAVLFDSVLDQVQAAERAGFDSVWVPDHLMQNPVVAPREEPMLECYTLMGALAASTSTLRLGAFVGCAAYRNAGLLAKALTTLDIISHGRAIFGVGAGWFEGEHDVYGYEFGSVAERFERLEEVIRIVKSMLTQDETTFKGRYFQMEGALNFPRPLHPGGIPVLIGGSGPKRTLRLVAQYADMCNLSGGPAKLRHLLSVLDQHCEEVGRDPDEICRTFINVVIVRDSEKEAYEAMPEAYRNISTEVTDHMSETVRPIIGTRDQCVERLREHVAAGIDGMVLSCAAQDRNGDYVELLGDLAKDVYS